MTYIDYCNSTYSLYGRGYVTCSVTWTSSPAHVSMFYCIPMTRCGIWSAYPCTTYCVAVIDERNRSQPSIQYYADSDHGYNIILSNSLNWFSESSLLFYIDIMFCARIVLFDDKRANLQTFYVFNHKPIFILSVI